MKIGSWSRRASRDGAARVGLSDEQRGQLADATGVEPEWADRLVVAAGQVSGAPVAVARRGWGSDCRLCPGGSGGPSRAAVRGGAAARVPAFLWFFFPPA